MQKSIVTTLQDRVMRISMNDGQKNLITPTMIREVNQALDLANDENAVVLLTGEGSIFSAGFDLKILKTGITDAFMMLNGAFRLAARLLSFPTPVVIACNGHSVAMGCFLLLTGDYRLGTTGKYKIVANEVAIGLTVPEAAIEICRQRLTPHYFERAMIIAEEFSPQSAISAGFLDRLVPPNKLNEEATFLAKHLVELDFKAHWRTKMRVRHHALKALNRAIRADNKDYLIQGANRLLKYPSMTKKVSRHQPNDG